MKNSAAQDDPIRYQITAAMERLLAGEPLRSTGRLSVSQLAVEAGVGRWHLTHQHTDLKDLFQAKVSNADGAPAAFARRLNDYEKLKVAHTKLLAHCAEIEDRLQMYASVIDLLALERRAASGRAAVTDIRIRRGSTVPAE